MSYYDINSIYKTPKHNGYGKTCAYKRFSFLKNLSFQSVLDVGSGPCLLFDWLRENKFFASYEAVDIRPDTLALCNCKTHTSIPQEQMYDLVCLFGTVTFNIDHDELKNKKILEEILKESLKVCKKWLVFTVFKESIREKHKNSIPKNFFVYFSREEISEMLEGIGIYRFEILEKNELDTQEYFVICDLKNI
jgi:hypothetical protein